MLQVLLHQFIVCKTLKFLVLFLFSLYLYQFLFGAPIIDRKMTFMHDLLSPTNQVSHVHTVSFFYLCLEPNLFRLFMRIICVSEAFKERYWKKGSREHEGSFEGVKERR